MAIKFHACGSTERSESDLRELRQSQVAVPGMGVRDRAEAWKGRRRVNLVRVTRIGKQGSKVKVLDLMLILRPIRAASCIQLALYLLDHGQDGPSLIFSFRFDSFFSTLQHSTAGAYRVGVMRHGPHAKPLLSWCRVSR